MKKINNVRKLYDGAAPCHTANCCPVAEQRGENVIVYDPQKPQKGKFEFTVTEYNDFIKNAKLA